MRLLLDENLHRRLGREIGGHEVLTVPQMGWAGVENGDTQSARAVLYVIPNAVRDP